MKNRKDEGIGTPLLGSFKGKKKAERKKGRDKKERIKKYREERTLKNNTRGTKERKKTREGQKGREEEPQQLPLFFATNHSCSSPSPLLASS